MLSYPKAILLDWDSTLVDGWNGMVSAFNHALTAVGKNPDMTRARAIAYSSQSPSTIFLEIFGPDDAQQAASVFYQYLSQPGADHVAVLPGSEDLLIGLRKLGLPMAIVSNKKGPMLEQEINHFGWRKYFFASVGAGVAAYDKPHAAPLLYALKQRMIPPGPDVWMVGDMHSDMEAANNAGVTAVLMETSLAAGVISEDRFRAHPPHLRVKDAMALLDLVNGLARTI